MVADPSRREFILYASAVTAGVGIPLRGATLFPVAKSFFGWNLVADGVYEATGGGGNTVVISGGTTSVLIDCKSLGLGVTLRREAEASVGPIGLAVNTHHHQDHSGGNSAFAADLPLLAHARAGARIVNTARRMLTRAVADSDGWVRRARGSGQNEADRETLDELRGFADTARSLDPESFAPTESFESEYEITSAGTAIELRHITNGHTDNDVFVYLPEQNIIHTGDLLFYGRHPYINGADGADTVGWQRNLDAIIDLCDADTVVIPGHGSVTTVSGLQQQHRYFDVMRGVVEAGLQQGRSRDEVATMTPDEFTVLTVPQFGARVLRTIYDELS